MKSLTSKFCLRCGSPEGPDNPLIEGLCLNCFVKERQIVKLPSKVVVVRCSSCGSIFVGGTWTQFLGDDRQALEEVVNKTFVKKQNINPNVKDVYVEVVGLYSGMADLKITARYGNAVVTQSSVIHYEILKRICPSCLSIKVKSYEAILQVRFVRKQKSRGLEVIRVKAFLNNLKNLRNNLTDYEELVEGIDIKLNDVSIARRIANTLKREFGGVVKESWKLHTVVRGKRHSKLTISVRVVGVKPDDYLIVGDEVLKVLNVEGSELRVKHLSKDVVKYVKIDDLMKEDFEIVPPDEAKIVSCTVAGYEGGELKLSCDDGSFRMVRKVLETSVSSKVKILIYKDSHYLIL